MNIIDQITSTRQTAFSFEVLPPLKGTGTEKLYNNIERLMEFGPSYINIARNTSTRTWATD